MYRTVITSNVTVVMWIENKKLLLFSSSNVRYISTTNLRMLVTNCENDPYIPYSTVQLYQLELTSVDLCDKILLVPYCVFVNELYGTVPRYDGNQIF